MYRSKATPLSVMHRWQETEIGFEGLGTSTPQHQAPTLHSIADMFEIL